MRAILSIGIAAVAVIVFSAVNIQVERVSILERQFQENMERRMVLDREFDEARRRGQDTSEIRARIDVIDAENQGISEAINLR